jgi:hypothetical protein
MTAMGWVGLVRITQHSAAFARPTLEQLPSQMRCAPVIRSQKLRSGTTVENCILAVLLIIFTLPAAIAQDFKGPPWLSADRCTTKDADAAESYRLKDWTSVYRVFQLYRQCDDGGVAENYSDGVATLLASQWGSVGQFARLARSNPQFERFVLLHIDSTMNVDQGIAIVANARDRCPADMRSLCKRIRRQVETAH